MTNYFVCATPRSGSYLLCEGLRASGVAGLPTEYLSPSYEGYWGPRWGATDYRSYLRHVGSAGRTGNGVFGAKVHPVQLDYFCRRLTGAPVGAPEARRKLLEEVFPDPRYVWLRRDDKLRQGISYARALQTHMWWDAEEAPAPFDQPRPAALRFDRVLLERCVTQMHLEERRWAAYFSHNGIEPLEVSYEELVGDRPSTLRRVLAHLGLTLPEDFTFAESRFRRQADDLTQRWANRLTALSVSQPAIAYARRRETAPAPRAAPTPQAAPTLEAQLGSRRWWKVMRPFVHWRVHDVFTGAAFRAMQEQYDGWRAAGRFARDIPGYDVTAMTVRRDDPGAFAVFYTRAWHDMVARLAGVDATGELNLTLHHHARGSASGRPHNDLNPACFAEEDRDAEGILVSDPRRCNYRTGAAADGLTVTERVRAVAVIFYLAGPDGRWGPGGETGLYRAISDPVAAPAVAVPPVPNSLVAFECTPFSYHSFLTNTGAERATLVMWLHRRREEVVRRWGEHSIVRW